MLLDQASHAHNNDAASADVARSGLVAKGKRGESLYYVGPSTMVEQRTRQGELSLVEAAMGTVAITSHRVLFRV